MKKRTFLTILLFLLHSVSYSQVITQTIKGKIIDEATLQPLSFATIVILETVPNIGTTSDTNGNFIIKNVPVGRYDLKISFIGYESIIKPEIVVTSSKEVVLNIKLTENSYSLDEIVIKPKTIKEKPINRMATVSARMLSIEEANRYAGGFDDPARLSSSFAGVASSVGNNAIIIRGNAPRFLQWKIEGVEIPNPNHFADLGVFGGGGLTALSSNLLANSDFLTGAFPAEYNNALSGVFDIKMRNGNNEEFEHSFEAGIIGIDFASEGPLSKKKGSSYLVNYRYSTLGLISSLLPEDAKGTNYQDLSFKLNFPTQKTGTFSIWGIGLIDQSESIPKTEIKEQKYYQDIEKQKVNQFMGALGINHKYWFKNAAYLNSTLAISTNGLSLKTDRLNDFSNLEPENKIENTKYNVTLKTFLNKKFSKKHINRSGITIRALGYNLTLDEKTNETNTLKNLVLENGFNTLISAYTSSSFSSKNWRFNMGINSQLFTLNNSFSLEPRMGINYQLNNTNALSLGYGLHSRIEPLNIYFANTINSNSLQANKELGFSKAHHFVLAYDWNISEKLHLKIEPYYQYLFNIPVIKDSTTSLLNLQNNWFINDAYVNSGKGQNYGIDLTLEQYINSGFYFLFSGSIFNSKYKTNTNVWYNTRFNKNFLFNALAGKEFRIGKNNSNLISVNVRFSYQGGDRFSAIDETRSIIEKDVVYNEMNPFTEQTNSGFISYFTINYEWYKKKNTQKLSLKILNATNHKDFQGHRYNIKTNNVEEYREALMIPNISYKISF
ncbi:TonB-dependent receptor [Tenacibaculum sp. M341]|uniref:TonB-dependent receptor n=1 Tax=Tenacibaculum sp. M341 TaxID=2530339 RepID=UPI0010511920|nr:carboxypeptidase-like regulatory domain-containing protein [Tenacibaculum sp. M341]TCI84531.1 TonB-dependent receptor [Tenacibaculum sp. M341]